MTTHHMTFWISLTLVVLPFAGSGTALAAFLVPTYTQNFDALGPTGDSLNAAGLSEWSVYRYNFPGALATTWTNSTGIPAASVGGGQLMDETQPPQNLGLFYNPSFPTFTRQGGVNAGHSTNPNDPNRALGTSPTGFAGNALQLTLTNNSGAGVTAVELSYDTVVLTVTGTNELPGYHLFYSESGVDGTWFALPNLDTITSSSDPAFKTYTTSGLLNLNSPLVNGGTLLIRWVDDNAQETSPDQMIAIDNVAVGSPVPIPATVIAAGFGGLSILFLRRNQIKR